jgi:hypothetical protein
MQSGILAGKIGIARFQSRLRFRRATGGQYSEDSKHNAKGK